MTAGLYLVDVGKLVQVFSASVRDAVAIARFDAGDTDNCPNSSNPDVWRRVGEDWELVQ
jgi:hypothetical protein